jgi:hypothetical protein
MVSDIQVRNPDYSNSIVLAYHYISIPTRYVLELNLYENAKNLSVLIAKGVLPFQFEFQNIMYEFVRSIGAAFTNDRSVAIDVERRVKLAWKVYTESNNYKRDNHPFIKTIELHYKSALSLSKYTLGSIKESFDELVQLSKDEDDYDRPTIVKFNLKVDSSTINTNQIHLFKTIVCE